MVTKVDHKRREIDLHYPLFHIIGYQTVELLCDFTFGIVVALFLEGTIILWRYCEIKTISRLHCCTSQSQRLKYIFQNIHQALHFNWMLVGNGRLNHYWGRIEENAIHCTEILCLWSKVGRS